LQTPGAIPWRVSSESVVNALTAPFYIYHKGVTPSAFDVNQEAKKNRRFWRKKSRKVLAVTKKAVPLHPLSRTPLDKHLKKEFFERFS
jgi:hypothetical protein